MPSAPSAPKPMETEAATRSFRNGKVDPSAIDSRAPYRTRNPESSRRGGVAWPRPRYREVQRETGRSNANPMTQATSSRVNARRERALVFRDGHRTVTLNYYARARTSWEEPVVGTDSARAWSRTRAGSHARVRDGLWEGIWMSARLSNAPRALFVLLGALVPIVPSLLSGCGSSSPPAPDTVAGDAAVHFVKSSSPRGAAMARRCPPRDRVQAAPPAGRGRAAPRSPARRQVRVARRIREAWPVRAAHRSPGSRSVRADHPHRVRGDRAARPRPDRAAHGTAGPREAP